MWRLDSDGPSRCNGTPAVTGIRAGPLRVAVGGDKDGGLNGATMMRWSYGEEVGSTKTSAKENDRCAGLKYAT